ncbi:hypothetical protein QR680_006786 [Steinernema hermaphroditum]|uniref:Uncharacterized protein n=1 Tax=Steinernema hermaphroditum TaxID=289476 RepID=A0AA39HZ15_9BILA|nr:hypothetical protein QR680_006786 [Steinernema hermaphroditum]
MELFPIFSTIDELFKYYFGIGHMPMAFFVVTLAMIFSCTRAVPKVVMYLIMMLVVPAFLGYLLLFYQAKRFPRSLNEEQVVRVIVDSVFALFTFAFGFILFDTNRRHEEDEERLDDLHED